MYIGSGALQRLTRKYLLVVLLVPLTGCFAGQDGRDGTSCTLEDNADGSRTLLCDDGSTVALREGGPVCSLVDVGAGLIEIRCNDDSSATVVGAPRDVFTGDVTISNSADMVFYREVSQIVGDLRVTGGEVAMRLVNLVSVTGNVILSEQLSGGQSVGGGVVVTNSAVLTGFAFPALASVGGKSPQCPFLSESTPHSDQPSVSSDAKRTSELARIVPLEQIA